MKNNTIAGPLYFSYQNASDTVIAWDFNGTRVSGFPKQARLFAAWLSGYASESGAHIIALSDDLADFPR